MIVFGCIILVVLFVLIILMAVNFEEKEIVAVSALLGLSFGLMLLAVLIESSGRIVDSLNHKGYNVWKEETRIGNKVIETTWHVAPKK
jgi:hypothetical protein